MQCLAAHKAHVVLILYRLLLLLQVSETIANIPFAPFYNIAAAVAQHNIEL